MAGYATATKNAFLNALLNATAYSVTSVYVSLHTADGADTGANEVTGGSYARQLASFGAASGGVCSTDALLEWLNMPAATITHVGLWTAVSGGTWLGGGALTVSKTTTAGDTLQIASADLDCDLNA